MSEETTVPQDTTAPAEDVTLSEEQLSELSSYDEDTAKTVKSALAQKDWFRDKHSAAEERAKTAETKIAEMEKAQAGGQKKSEGETKAEYEGRIARLEFSVQHPGTTEEILTEVEAYAKAKGVTLGEAYKTPLMQTFVKEQAAAKEADGATPGPSNRVAVSGVPAFEKIASLPENEVQKVVRGMSKEDFQKYLEWRKATSAPSVKITKALNV